MITSHIFLNDIKLKNDVLSFLEEFQLLGLFFIGWTWDLLVRDSEQAAMVSSYIICVVFVRNIKHSLIELLLYLSLSFFLNSEI
jgi:hypothetical protein